MAGSITETKYEKVLAFLRGGESDAATSRKAGVCTKTVAKIRRRHDIPRRQQPHPNSQVKFNGHSAGGPFRFRAPLEITQNGLCAWPPCGLPLYGSQVFVDHNHNCLNHEKQYACTRCIRGAVHRQCNMPVIAAFDLVRATGVVLPPEIEAYLAKGDPPVSVGDDC